MDVLAQNITAVVVWYNPNELKDNSAVKNIISYSAFLKKVYIVDNSDADNAALAEQVPNAVYIANRKNLGIAQALNIGCGQAMKDGFEWCMTMDQDSAFNDAGNFEKYVHYCQPHMDDPKIKSFTIWQKDTAAQVLPFSKIIRFKVLSPIKRFLLRQKNLPAAGRPISDADLPEEIQTYSCITSANIISLATWNSIGRFDERLFIDEVDNDFCARLYLAGYSIWEFDHCHVNHTLGEEKKSFSYRLFGKHYNYSAFRMYYIFRNLMICQHRYAKNFPHGNFKKRFNQAFRDYCFLTLRPVQHLKVFLNAFKDYKTFIKNTNQDN